MHATIYVYPGSDSNRSLDASKSDARTATLNSVIRGAMTDTEQVFGVEYRDNLKQAVEYFAAVIESRFPHLPPWMDAYERIEQHRAKIDELTEQLATAEAELAAYRSALEWYREQVRRSYECTGAGQRIAEQKLIDDAIDARDGRDVAGKALTCTAGRDMLAAMQAKDERIAELEKRNDELQLDLNNVDHGDHISYRDLRLWAESKPVKRVCDAFGLNTPISIIAATIEKLRDSRKRYLRKCRTAKAALVESRERIAELEKSLQESVDSIMPSMEELAEMATEPCQEWRDDRSFAEGQEPKPVEWQYRTRGASVFRFNGREFSVFSNGIGWVTPITYTNWQACVDDPSTYPCDEHGERTTP
jgi:hypothetical protein